MKIILLLLGVVVVGVVAWSLAVLPDQSKQDKLGASVEQGVGGLLQQEQEPPVPSPEITSPTDSSISSSTLAEAEIVAPSPITVLVSPSSASAGKSVIVTVATVNDTPIFWLMDIYLESSTGLTSAQGSIINIDGEGRRFGSVSIPADAEPGVWKVKTVEITDTEGAITSYSYGKEIFSTFQVE